MTNFLYFVFPRINNGDDNPYIIADNSIIHLIRAKIECIIAYKLGKFTESTNESNINAFSIASKKGDKNANKHINIPIEYNDVDWIIFRVWRTQIPNVKDPYASINT
jgi:hypothetical protein